MTETLTLNPITLLRSYLIAYIYRVFYKLCVDKSIIQAMGVQ